MAKSIKVEISDGGQIHMELSGFQGRTCFDEADAFKRELMNAYGIETSDIKVVEKKTEVEAARLPGTQTVGHGG
jgi:hypothetical protein